MKKENQDQSAFPEIKSKCEFKGSQVFSDTYSSGGLTKREYFAGLAMQGLCASGNESYQVNGSFVSPQPLIDDAIRIADELLKQLSHD